MVIDLDKTSAKIKGAIAILGLLGIANFGDIVRLTRSFFGARVQEAPALVQEIKERKSADSAIVDTLETVSYELKRVKTQNIRFQAVQVSVDPKLRTALEQYSDESRSAKAKRERTEKLLEGLTE